MNSKQKQRKFLVKLDIKLIIMKFFGYKLKLKKIIFEQLQVK
jgi:hypothetical protein